MSNSKTLRLNDPAIQLGVARSKWAIAFQKAQPDLAVGIRHAALSGNQSWRIHVAAIPTQVGCHYHQQGDETYEVVQGEGTLHFGEVVSAGKESTKGFTVKWASPLEVTAGDCFVIPQGYAHQLKRRGAEDLTILFACPDAHIDDAGDRHHLADSPNL